ncbi:MAG: histidine kinase [Myxococcaceae bacterium]|nr:histidine kinase [Myxococcaceae bacterium]
MIPFDPLADALAVAIADEMASLARHDLRNKLGIIRNATFYLRRRVEGSSLPTEDARIVPFFKLVDDEVVGMDQLIDARLVPSGFFARSIVSLDPSACLADAIRLRRANAGDTPFELHYTPVEASIRVDADRIELTLALRCLIEHASRAPQARITEQVEGSRWLFSIEDNGPPLPATPEVESFGSFASLRLAIARRIAHRFSGQFTHSAGRLELSLPTSAPSAPTAPRE